jgi:hypothetical protein
MSRDRRLNSLHLVELRGPFQLLNEFWKELIHVLLVGRGVMENGSEVVMTRDEMIEIEIIGEIEGMTEEMDVGQRKDPLTETETAIGIEIGETGIEIGNGIKDITEIVIMEADIRIPFARQRQFYVLYMMTILHAFY